MFVGYRAGVNRLLEYLRQNIFLDFNGELTVEKLRELIAGDDSREAKALLARVTRDKGTNDMMLLLADCLLETVQNALTDDVMREQVRAYVES
jgi:hypothetical protein